MSDTKILVDWGNKYGLPRGNEVTQGIQAQVGPIIFMD